MDQRIQAAKALRDIFDIWKAIAPSKRSFTSLSKTTNVPVSTIHRILEGGMELTVDKVVILLEELAIPSVRITYLETYFPQFSSFITKTYKLEEKAQFPELEEVADESFKETIVKFYYFQVLSMLVVDEKVGVPLEKIENEFGQSGLNALSDLIEKNYVSRNKEGRFWLSSKMMTSDQQLLLQLVKNTCLRLEHGSTRFNVFCYLRSLNRAGISELKKETDVYQSKVLDIIANKDFEGDIPLSCSALLGALESDTTDNKMNRGEK